MDNNNNNKSVSYSQFSKWLSCRHQWYLDYACNLRVYDANLTLSYGNAIHETLQQYVKTLYTDGMIKASTLNLKNIFIEAYIDDLTKNSVKYDDAELKEFMTDGVEFIKEFTKASIRLEHFPANKYEFLGIEDELSLVMKYGIKYSGYIDLVLREKITGRIKIFDFKTARLGWNSSQMEDIGKTSQLILYKALYSKKHGIPASQIDVEFLILKRKLYENTRYKQTRIQVFRPISTQAEITRVLTTFDKFIEECFNADGTYKTDKKYPKIPGKNKKNCKYCPHKGTNCDAIADILDDSEKFLD